ncbi:MAG: hypothetical protein ACYTBJ_03560 [Planctomycetota bacterium]|jgi:hypothetical protein
MKRTVPLIITFVVGLVLIFSVFFPYTESLGEDFSVFFDIIASIAFVLGGGNLVKMFGIKIIRRRAGWGYALVAVIGFLVTLAVGLLKIGNTEGFTGNLLDETSYFKWVYDYIFKPCGATMFALLAFYVASAAYRAFRAKNTEAIILLVTAFIILLGRTFLGTFATMWLPAQLDFLKIPNIASWIMVVLNQAGNRAIMIGISLGIISTSLKVILGIDRSYLGSE